MSNDDRQRNAEEAQIRRECYVNILGFLRLPKDAEFFGDCNHPGVVYWTSQGRLEDAKESLRQEGGSPFGITRSSACSWVTHPDDDLMDGWPWSLREWTNFW